MGFIIFIIATVFIIVRIAKSTPPPAKPGTASDKVKQVRRMNPAEYPTQRQHQNAARTKQAKPKTEEMSTREGECIEKDPNHCAVRHTPDSVYANEITDEPRQAFSREQLVNGIIVAELLSKPKCFDDRKF